MGIYCHLPGCRVGVGWQQGSEDVCIRERMDLWGRGKGD